MMNNGLFLFLFLFWINTYATKPPKKATGPPPIKRIFRWHESKSDDRACAGGDGWVCIPIMPPDVGPWPTMCEGDRNMFFLFSLVFLHSKSTKTQQHINICIYQYKMKPTKTQPPRTHAHTFFSTILMVGVTRGNRSSHLICTVSTKSGWFYVSISLEHLDKTEMKRWNYIFFVIFAVIIFFFWLLLHSFSFTLGLCRGLLPHYVSANFMQN